MKKRAKKSSYLVGGGAIGAVNGLFGGGGGMIAVPLLERLSLPARAAHATAIAVILPASALSGIVYACHGLTPLHILLPGAIGVTAGGFFGAKLLSKVGAKFLELMFAALMLIAGVRMLFP